MAKIKKTGEISGFETFVWAVLIVPDLRKNHLFRRNGTGFLF